MSVSGSVETPIIGLTRRDRSTHDLLDCSLSTEPIQRLLHQLALVISDYSLTPYDIENRTGELKFMIVTTTQDHKAGILRFVLRSRKLIPRVSAAIPHLQSTFPWIAAVSCNIQPLPAAIIEGPEEVLLTESPLIREQFGAIPLYFAPQSFMQVTPEIASQLYARAADIVQAASPHIALDLYCGVGGFSLSAAPYCQRVYGVELSQQAILCATRSANELRYRHAEFTAADVDQFVQAHAALTPNLLIVNPPRRGLSEAVRDYVRRAKPQQMIYSSCNVETFAHDVAALCSDYTLVELTPFDMFPMTMHWEVLGVLIKR
jgi:23S rRNA (uracil747-C5)-methyltransferase